MATIRPPAISGRPCRPRATSCPTRESSIPDCSGCSPPSSRSPHDLLRSTRVRRQDAARAPRERPMRAGILSTVLAATAVTLLGGVANAQQGTHLRFGLAGDPDVLDPTFARTYVGRIVFASLCDKLFDIDEKLNIVPQLALSSETSGDGKAVTIRLRPGVKFHD